MTLTRAPRSSQSPKPSLLTPRQRDALVAFRRFHDRNGRSPSFDELAEEMAVSKSTVRVFVRKLVSADCLGVTQSRYRPWVLTVRGKLLSAKGGVR